MRRGRWPNPRVTFNREAVAGVTENMVTVTQPLPVTGRRGLESSAASALWLRRARVEPTTRSAVHAPSFACLRRPCRLRKLAKRELTRSRDRLRELAEVLDASGSSRRSGWLRSSARRARSDWTSRLMWSAARTDRVRRRRAVAAFFADPDGPSTTIVASPTAPTSTPRCRRSRNWWRERSWSAAKPLALRAGDRGGALRASRLPSGVCVPEPEVVAGTKSSNVGGGDRRQRLQRPRHACRCSTARSPSRRWRRRG